MNRDTVLDIVVATLIVAAIVIALGFFVAMIVVILQ